MGLKLSNYQLKLLMPIVINAARETPDLELDAIVDRMIEMAKFRGMTMTRISPNPDPNDMQGLALAAERERPEPVLKTAKPKAVKPDAMDGVHPLFRDQKKPRKNTAA